MTDVYMLEGGDLVGKTTMANRLKDQLEADGLPVVLVHFGAPIPGMSNFDLYAGSVQQAIDSVGEHGAVVVDRFYIGEEIYGPIRRGKSSIVAAEIGMLERFLNDIGAVRYWLDEPIATIIRRYEQRGDEFLTIEQVIQAAKHYKELMPKRMKLYGWETPPTCDGCSDYFAHPELDSDGLCEDCTVEAAKDRADQLAEDRMMEQRAGIEW